MRILLVEDEEALGKNLTKYLAAEGYQTSVSSSLSTARAAILKKPHLVLLDWMLPDGSGTELLREWRKKDVTIPVILLTAKSELVDKVLGLELGANDYITKPFEPRELLARINVQLRGYRHPTVFHDEQYIRGAEIEMDTGTRIVKFRGRCVDLTRLEFELLKLFLKAPGQVFPRTELLNTVWGYDNYPTTRTVDNHVSQLRKKFSSHLFELVHRVGYRFVPKELT